MLKEVLEVIIEDISSYYPERLDEVREHMALLHNNASVESNWITEGVWDDDDVVIKWIVDVLENWILNEAELPKQSLEEIVDLNADVVGWFIDDGKLIKPDFKRQLDPYIRHQKIQKIIDFFDKEEDNI